MLIEDKKSKIFIKIFEMMKEEFPELEFEKTSGNISYLLTYQKIVNELVNAEKFPPFASLHEGYAVLKEEVEEFWDLVKGYKYNESIKESEDLKKIGEELIQIAAMAVKNLQLVEKMKAKIQEAKG